MPVVLGKKCLLECDLVIVAGASSSFEFVWEKEAPDGTLVPADLNGSSAICQIRVVNDGEVVADLSEFVEFDGPSVIIAAPAYATERMQDGKFVWDIMVTEPNGITTRLAAGKATVVDPISEVE